MIDAGWYGYVNPGHFFYGEKDGRSRISQSLGDWRHDLHPVFAEDSWVGIRQIVKDLDIKIK